MTTLYCSTSYRTETRFCRGNHNRGIAYNKKGAYDLAIKDYTAIKLKPADAEAYRSRGTAYESRGEQDLAVRDYNTAKRLKPDDALEEAETKGFLRSMDCDLMKLYQANPLSNLRFP